MQMVAAVKMRRTQQALLATRPYAAKMQALLANLAAMPQDDPDDVHPLLRRREVQRVMLVHVTPDRGLCGSLPGALNRRAGGFVLGAEGPVAVVAVGRKGRDFMVRTGRNVRAIFLGLTERPSLLDTTPIARLVIDDFSSGEVDAVHLVYSQFVNLMNQRPVTQQLLPVEPASLSAEQAVGYLYEPDSFQVLEDLLPRYVAMQIYHAILEANASEQSARMVAMKSATDNANDLIRDMTLAANRARQDAITSELLDIIAGSMTFQ